MLNTFQNLSNDYSLGGEAMANLGITSWFELNTSLSVYDYWLEGNVNNEDVDKHSINWSAKMSSTFNFKHDMRGQLMLVYRGPSVTAQGSREGMYMTSIAFKKGFFANRF